MSAQAYSWACRQTGMRPGAKLLLAMIANHADKSGVSYPGRNTLAEECCYRPASVTDNMAQLIEGGWLARLERRRANGSKTSDWLVLGPAAVDRGDMTDADPQEYPAEIAEIACRKSGSVSVPEQEGSGSVSHAGQVRFSGGPETSVEPTTSQGTAERQEQPETTNGFLDAQLVAREKKSATRLFGKVVPASLVADALAALDFYCDRTGQRIKPYTARGKPSEALTRIMRAMTDHPEVRTLYRRMIDRCLAAPWWNGEPHVGVIFGPGVVEQSIVKARGEGNGYGHRLHGTEALLHALSNTDSIDGSAHDVA